MFDSIRPGMGGRHAMHANAHELPEPFGRGCMSLSNFAVAGLEQPCACMLAAPGMLIGQQQVRCCGPRQVLVKSIAAAASRVASMNKGLMRLLCGLVIWLYH